MQNEVKKVADDLKKIRNGKDLFTKDLKEYLDYQTTDAIRMAVSRGKLPYKKRLGRLRFDPEETARYLVK